MVTVTRQGISVNFQAKKDRLFFDTRFVRHERRGTLVLACLFLWSCLFFLGFNRFVYASVEVVGQSMSPRLQEGERRLVNRWIYLFYPPQRGDVVVIRDPVTGLQSVKRIIGLPGERLESCPSGLHVNGDHYDDPYVATPNWLRMYPLAARPVRVPADSYYVAGDNRPVSEDSRSYGSIPRKAILGSVEDQVIGRM